MKRSSTWIIVALSLVIMGLLTALAYMQWRSPTNTTNNTQQSVNSFESCATAGNAIMESYPRRCRDAASGITYTEKINETPTEQTPATRTYTSPKGIKIELNDWVDNKLISSPFTITGRAPGNWAFEASFPIELLASSESNLITIPAALTGDWMTTELVPFTATLSFDESAAGETGTLILRKDNPSGLAENDDSIRIPIRYQ